MTILITGIANERSIAWAIAQRLRAAGHSLLLSWQGPAQEKRVRRLIAPWQQQQQQQQQEQHVQGATCDMSRTADIERLADWCREIAPHGLSGLVHAPAFGRMTNDNGDPLSLGQISSADMAECLQISAHSFNQLIELLSSQWVSSGAQPTPSIPPASAIALSYFGAERVTPGYDLMATAKAALECGVKYQAVQQGPHLRVNAIRAGSIRTAASSAAPGFAERHARSSTGAPIGRPITATDIANTAEFLLSPQSSAITGQIITVDGGWSLLAP